MPDEMFGMNSGLLQDAKDVKVLEIMLVFSQLTYQPTFQENLCKTNTYCIEEFEICLAVKESAR